MGATASPPPDGSTPAPRARPRLRRSPLRAAGAALADAHQTRRGAGGSLGGLPGAGRHADQRPGRRRPARSATSPRQVGIGRRDHRAGAPAPAGTGPHRRRAGGDLRRAAGGPTGPPRPRRCGRCRPPRDTAMARAAPRPPTRWPTPTPPGGSRTAGAGGVRAAAVDIRAAVPPAVLDQRHHPRRLPPGHRRAADAAGRALARPRTTGAQRRGAALRPARPGTRSSSSRIRAELYAAARAGRYAIEDPVT